MIELPETGGPEGGLWHTLLDLAEMEPAGWTLIGGLMVYLRALEEGRVPPRVTRDVDVLADLRTRPAVLPRIVATLETLEFEVELASPDASGHRFHRGDISNRPPRTRPPRHPRRPSHGRPLTTVSIAGGSYALERSRPLDISFDGRQGTIPCPDLAGALVIKSEAARSDRILGPERHLSDLAVLFSIVPDPFTIRDVLGARNAQRIAAARALDNDEHEGPACARATSSSHRYRRPRGDHHQRLVRHIPCARARAADRRRVTGPMASGRTRCEERC